MNSVITNCEPNISPTELLGIFAILIILVFVGTYIAMKVEDSYCGLNKGHKESKVSEKKIK